MACRSCSGKAARLFAAVAILAAAVPSHAERKPPGPLPSAKPAFRSPAGAARPLQKPENLAKPDLYVGWFGLGEPYNDHCHAFLVVINNRGDAPLSASAYAATDAEGGVSVTVEMIPSYGSSVPVGTVLLRDLDPDKLAKPAKSHVGIGNAFRIELPEEMYLSVLSPKTFRVAVDTESRVDEEVETNNVREASVSCP